MSTTLSATHNPVASISFDLTQRLTSSIVQKPTRLIIMKSILIWLFTAVAIHAHSQNTLRAYIKDASTREPLPGATASMEETGNGASANLDGFIEIRNIPDGKQKIIYRYVGYESQAQELFFPINSTDTLLILLQSSTQALDEVTVTATRSSRSIEDIPMRIETIVAGELEEKAVMQPGNIKMVLTESTGIQTQQTSATSASTSIRIQGLDGKYTQLLKDGFPLYSGFSAGLSILQIPPLDLKRVEVIKGSASTLYGGGAIAGLINLVTKEPTSKRELSLLTNGNQTKALDVSGYYGQRFKKWGITLFAARNTQKAYDRNKDGFSDIPAYTRYTFNPKLFFYGKQATLRVGVNAGFENRTGGDMNVIAGRSDAVHKYFEKNKSNRYATQLSYEKRIADNLTLTIKNSVGYFARKISLADYIFSGTQRSSYTEINLLKLTEQSEWVGGLNGWTDNFVQSNTTAYPLDYTLNTLGAFVQNNFKASPKLIVESGVRLDYNNQKNAFVLPRASLLYKLTRNLTSRIGGGLGYKAPTLFSEEAEARSFRAIQPLDLSVVNAEKSIGGNFDINYKHSLSEEADITINQLFFYTTVRNPLILGNNLLANGNLAFTNAHGNLISKGIETNVRLSFDEVSFYLGYTFINAVRVFDNIKTVNPLTARNRINMNILYEVEDKVRLAYELFYIGQQNLSTGEKAKSYWVMGVSGELMFNHVSLFLNAENFLDSRQTRFSPIYTGTIQNPQFKEIYSPIDGFIFNGGFRLKL